MNGKYMVVLGWGSHGAGKTHLLERLEREFYGRFIACFGDLYGNKLEQPDKINLMAEAYRIGATVILEGKRFVDNSFFDAIVTNVAKDPDKESVLLIAYSQPAASISRVNQRRVQRGQEANFAYQEGRELYECVTRFDNKIRTLYEEHPVEWSAVNLFHLDVTDVTAWEPFYKKMADHLAECPIIPAVIEKDPTQYPWLSYFWKSRRDSLDKKGQEYSDFRPPVSMDFNQVTSSPVIPPTPSATSVVPPPTRPATTTTPDKLKVPTSKASMEPMIVPVAAPSAERVQMSKVRRGLRNVGFQEWERLTDDQVKSIVGGLLAIGINPADKGSEAVGRRCLSLAQTMVAGLAPLPLEAAPVAAVPDSVATPTPTPEPTKVAVVPKADAPTPTPTPSPPPPLPPPDTGTTSIMIGQQTNPGRMLKDMIMKTLTPVEAANPVALLGVAIHVPPEAPVDSEPLALEEIVPEVAEIELPMRPPEITEPLPPEESANNPLEKKIRIQVPVHVRQGFVEADTCHEGYLHVLQDLLCNAPVTKRGHLLFLSFKPYTMSVKNADDYLLCLPGSLYYDPIGIMPRYAVEWLEGDIIAGGYSYRFDARRQRRYAKASGEIDWSIKNTMADKGAGGMDWLRRNLRQDSTSRNASVSVWDNDRDLKGYTARKEIGMQAGKTDSYTRLACPLNFSFTRDDGDKDNKKALQTYASFRAMDYTTAIHSDMMRLGEAAHWLALTTENRSYNGRMKMDIASIVFESYGASQFAYFNNLLDWWKSDPRCTSIHKIYGNKSENFAKETEQLIAGLAGCHFQDREVAKAMQSNQLPLQWGQPAQKSYDWFLARWTDFQKCDYHWRKGQWWHVDETWKQIAYPHWQDISLAVAITEMTILETFKPEIVRLYGTNKQVQRSMAYETQVGMYLPFFFLEKIKGPYHYYASVFLISHLLALSKFDLIRQMSELPSIQKVNLFDIMLSDALVSQTGKRPRDAFIAACPELYGKIAAHCDVIMERK